MIEILRPGPLATIQDLGRPGYAHLGVGRSGAADRDSLRLANRLVGNPEGAAGLEVTFGGLAARFHTRALIALTGAPAPARLVPRPAGDPTARLVPHPAGGSSARPAGGRRDGDGAGRGVAAGGPVEVAAGSTLVLGTPERGVRTYLAVRGGIDVPAVFGSRATDLLGGLGPPAVETGTRLAVGTRTAGFPVVDVAPTAEPGLTLPVRPGPRADWFEPGALAGPYTVTAQSNRVGLRLDGRLLPHRERRELPTEGMAEGSVQVPPSGQPILMLADHPVTGGYPVIAVVDQAAIGAAAQARPGDQIQFVML